MGIGIVLAARLESIAQPDTVLISGATHRLVQPFVQVAPLGPTAVKGRTQPVHVFEVTSLRTAAELGETLGVRSPLVGRAVELSMLRCSVAHLLEGPEPPLLPGSPSSDVADLFALDKPIGACVAPESEIKGDPATRRGAIVHVVGEAGVGKSRLIRHVRNEMTAGYPQLTWLTGRALSQGQGAYGVLADLVRGYVGIGVDDSPDDMWAKLRNRMGRLFSVSPSAAGDRLAGEGSGEVAELIPHLANLLTLPIEGDQARQVSDLEPEAQERQIFRALRRLCEQLTELGPLVLFFDDLQVADGGAIRLLQDLMVLIDERPVLFLFSFRPQLGADCWELRDLARRVHEHDNVEIVLHSLPTEACNELIDNLLECEGGEEISESVRGLIRERSGGNPLFIEEVVRSLIDRGVLERSGERWQVVSQVPANYIPDTLHGVISARLDRLDPRARRTLQIAAVIGHTFSSRVLQAVAQGNGNPTHHLAHLQRAELIRELRRGAEQEYTFTHTLTQQVAYETLLRRQRRDYHQRVAQSIEKLYANRLEEHYERLAYHYAGAKDWPRALDYHIKFAAQAQMRFANGKAGEHYQRAWEIVQSGRAGDEETQLLLHESQANLDFLSGDYQTAIFRYEAAQELASEPPDLARLLRKLGNVFHALGNFERAAWYLDQGIDVADTIGRGPALASLYVGLGQVRHRQGNYQQATELGLLSLEIFEQIDNQPGAALASNLLGIVYWAMGDLGAARSYLEKSLLVHASLGDVHGLAASYNNLGRVLADQGKLERATGYFRQSQQLCLEIGYQHGLATALSHLSESYQRLGQTEEAWACQESAFEIYNRIGFDGFNVQPEVLRMQVW
jgi:predicted ATPase